MGVRLALESGGLEVCAEVADAAAAVEAAVRERPDVCLIDIKMPGGGINAAAAISQQVPESSIVMLTVSRSDADLFDALRAGASGYLLKDLDPDRLPHALRGVLDGEAVLPQHLVTLLIEELRGRGRRRLPLLRRNAGGEEVTPQEWQVLELMRQGHNTEEIAAGLSIDPVAVRAHVWSILKKLRVPDRQAALRLLED